MKKIDQINSRKSVKLLSFSKLRGTPTHNRKHSTTSKGIFGRKVLHAPIFFDIIEGDIEECFDFFEKLKDLIRSKRSFYISFKETSSIKAMTLLLLYSNIDILRSEGNDHVKISIIWSKRSSNVNRVLRDSGNFLRADQRELLIKDKNPLPVIMGNNYRVNDLADKIIDSIMSSCPKHLRTPSKEYEFGSAINETLENVGRHAYPNTSNHKEKKWWMMCDFVDDNLFLAIYDSGVGIPNTISSNNNLFLTRINKLYPKEFNGAVSEDTNNLNFSDKISTIVSTSILRKNLSDGQLIRAAMHADVTSTDMSKHGQGSKSIKNLITSNEDSFLLILSNYGYYSFGDHANDNDSSIAKLEQCIRGTLIQWSI